MLPVGMMSFGSVRHQAPQCLERSSAKGEYLLVTLAVIVCDRAKTVGL